MGTWLRVVQINDVYILDNLSKFKTLVDLHSDGPDKVLVVLAGDFLGPSSLSSLDKGVGMVDCLKACGVTHVCFGNHEADIPGSALPERVEQSGFCWVNSNMQEMNEKLGMTTPTHDIVTVGEGVGSKKVAILGFLTDEEGLLRPGAFGGAKVEPPLETADELVSKLRPETDLLLPMTHLDIERDREFLKHFGGDVFPIVMGGHDHEVYDEVHNGARIVKTGMDAQKAAVIDFKWPDGNTDSAPSSIDVKLLNISAFEADVEMEKRIQAHHKVLEELEKARLFRVQDWTGRASSKLSCFNDDSKFSTFKNRLGPSLGSTVLTTLIRMGMRVPCAICNAGSIRGGKEYPSDAYFTICDLKAEVPFSTLITTLSIPGRVLEATIAHSRRGTKADPPVESGGYIHTCDNIEYDDEKQAIEKIQGEDFDPDKEYLTALPRMFLEGIDNQEPLLQWAEENQITTNVDAVVPAKMLMVEVFSALLWLEMGSFADIDLDSDGFLSRDEVKQRVVEIYGPDIADLVVDNIMGVADMNDDDTISPLEMMVVQYVATDIVSHVCTEDEMACIKEVAIQVLGKSPKESELKKLVEKVSRFIDHNQDGKFTRSEVMKALGDLETIQLLS